MFLIILGIIILLVGVVIAALDGFSVGVALVFVVSIGLIASSAAQRRKKKLAKKQIKQELGDKNASWRGEYPHAVGLPIAESVNVQGIL